MLGEFQRYLIKNARDKDKYIAYYLKWISDCYSFNNERVDHRLNSEQKQQFLSHLAKNHEDWQVRQADYAIRLYNFFLSHQGRQLSSYPSDIEKEWGSVENGTRKALRLRHRSLSTEKSYIIWLRQFRKFIVTKKPQELEGIDIQNFLSHYDTASQPISLKTAMTSG